MSIKVGIIQYGLGNTASVLNAFTALGANAEVVTEPKNLIKFSHVVLPGVGAFRDGMRNLTKMGWIKPLHQQVIKEKKYFLGICLGMQLLATRGTEHGNWEGMGWIEGEVRKINPVTPNYPIPHIGWNDVSILRKDGNFNLLSSESADFYFLHSYAFSPLHQNIVDSWCNYGIEFAASLSYENIRAVQFHPEKSQKMGLKVLKSFLDQPSFLC